MQVDEVICVIETDKVAFEVRAPEAGVIKSVSVQAGQTVEVGAPILTLDTAGVATVGSSSGGAAAAAVGAATGAAAAAAAGPPPAVAAPPAAVAAPPLSAAAALLHARVPSLHFRYGKRDVIDAQMGRSRPKGGRAAAGGLPAATAPAGSYMEQLAKAFPSKATRTYLDLPPAYGRPRVSEAEARAIESGGAY